MATSSSSEMLPKLWQVFINLRGEELRDNFMSRLVGALNVAEIKYCIDTNELPSEDPNVIFTRIELSEIALVIFSRMYAESDLCLDKLVMIMEQVKEGKVRIIPVFFNVTPEEFGVKAGEFELKLYGKGKKILQNNIPYWKNAWLSVPSNSGLNRANFRNEREFINEIVDSVKRELGINPPVSTGGRRGEHLNGPFPDLSYVSSYGDISSRHMVHPTAPPLSYGMNTRLEVKQESGSENLGTCSFQNQENREKPRSLKIPLYTTPVYSTNNHVIIPPPPPPLPPQYQVFPVYSTNNHGIIPPPPPPPLPQYQVFINFRGDELRKNFVGHLDSAMKLEKINVFIDADEMRGKELQNLFKRIKESRVAVAIFSERYTESHWCLDELVVMKEQMDQGKLVVIPVFYKLSATACKNLEGAFGDKFRRLKKQYRSDTDKNQIKKKWKEALAAVFNNAGLIMDPDSYENIFIESIVKHVKRALIATFVEERKNSKNPTTVGNEAHLTDQTLIGEREEPDTTPRFGVEQRLKQLEDKLHFGHEQTRFVGVVGMPGIGKSILAKMLYEKWEHKFKSGMFFPDIGKMSKEHGVDWLQKRLMQEQLEDIHPNIGNAHEFWKDDLLNRKVFVVLDDVSVKEQINFLFENRDWIKKGSKIVIISRDESLLQDLVNDTYVVPRLNSRDSILCFRHSLLCFNNHAFGLDYAKGIFIKLSRKFLDYAKGNPLALKAFGVELGGKDEAFWRQRIGTLTQISNKMIEVVLSRRYDDLTWRQKDAFLDVACFFQSENADFVRCMVGSSDYKFTKVRDEIRDLTDKFLINISGGRVEMDDLLCTFAKEHASQALRKNTRSQFRLWNHQDISYVRTNKLGMRNVRDVSLDMSKVPENLGYNAKIFSSMCNLLYLRIYSSAFLQEGKDDFKIFIPKDFQLPLVELRYLHWVKFSSPVLPPDFNAKKLVNLELPHSSIKQLWEGVKDTPKLKWVDLSYSRRLRNLSGLSNAQNLERLNLEGCRKLVNLPQDMENMKSLIFLNMRGCKRLRFLPVMKLSSLKILILSDCSQLQEFEVISENLEALYLDGTALKELPPAVGDLERLSILNLKGCKTLESLPESLGKQKALEELILSGCSKLESVPKDVQNMIYLRILLLDGTRIKEMPKMYSLQRLWLSTNNAMICLQDNISQLYHLKWLELMNCKNLRYLPTLPPNLELFDAHGCEKLEAVANPLALCIMTGQIHSTFFFTNCNNLNQDARDVISSYAQWKCQRLALEGYDRGVVSGSLLNFCFPGFEVPSWFHHRAAGSVLEPRLQPRWCNSRLSGIALCAVVSFHENYEPTETFSIKCILQLNNEDGSRISLDYDFGGLTEPRRIESDHIFIGYASFSHLRKRLENQNSGNSTPTKAFLEFHVSVACKSEVVNCGISFVYAEPQHVPVEANRHISSSKAGGGWIDHLVGYIILAFVCVIFFGPHYYLGFLKFCWPLVVLFLSLLAIGLFPE